MGHTALCYWQRYDIDSNTSINANATEIFASANESAEPSILGAPSTVTDPRWYPDSGATHHSQVTSMLLPPKPIIMAPRM